MSTIASVAAFAVGLCLGPAVAEEVPAPAGGVTWVMLNVNARGQEGDAHLLVFPGGQTVLIDTGWTGQDLGPSLRARGIERLDQVVITHPHRDHYSALRELLAENLPIGEVFLNLPDQVTCERETPWGCDFQDVQRLVSELRAAGVPVRSAVAGMSVARRPPDISLEIVAAADQRTSPVPNIDTNDMSLILGLQVGRVRALFAGDLNHLLGTYFATRGGPEFGADLLKVPHHGAELTVPDAFFDLVSPTIALVPAPRSLWESDRCARVRRHLQKMGVSTFVSGIDGDVRVDIRADGFAIFTGADTNVASDPSPPTNGPSHAH